MAIQTSQTVGRAFQLLRLIASSKSRDVRLIDIAEMAALDKSTAHRLLQRLVHERVLVRDPVNRGYRLGPLLYELGLAALPDINLREAAESELEVLARHTGDMTFLIGRSGFETVCLSRIVGSYEIQTMTRNIGDRHPLGIGAGSLAILAALKDDEIRIVLQTIEPQLTRYGLTSQLLWERIHATRDRGYALDESVAASDVVAMGRVVRNRMRTPIAAVFVASIASRFTPRRGLTVDRHISDCVTSIESALAH
jgi:DNA-binding IclR family transcriptional regulator